MNDLLKQMISLGLVPADMTLEEFKRLYGGSAAKTLHNQLKSKTNNFGEPILSKDLMNFDNFNSRFELNFSPDIIPTDDEFRVEVKDSFVPEKDVSIQTKRHTDKVNTWYNSELEALDIKNKEGKIKNYNSQLKNLNKQRDELLAQGAEYSKEVEAIGQVNNYVDSEGVDAGTWNPLIEFSTPSPLLAAYREGKDTSPGSQAQLEDKLKTQEGLDKAKTGLHSWMWPELNVNLKRPDQLASEGDVDVDNDLGNQLWKTKDEWDGTTQENLVQVLQTQYPGYKFKEKSGKRETIEGTNIDGREIIVTAPNGETTSIYGGIQGRTTFTDKSNVNNEVRNQKINLTNFINKNGIDLKQVAGKFAGTTQQYYQLINTPYNSENVNLGGIGLDKRQQNTLNSIGLVQYVADKDGKISEEFTYNPELFKGTYEKWIEQEKAFLEAEPGRYSEFYMTQQGSLVVKGLLTKEDLDNWDTKEVRDKVSQLLTDQYPRYEQYQDFDRDEKGNITSATKKTKTRKLVRNDLIRLQGSVMGREQVGTTGGDGEFIAVGENSELYKRTKQALENTYSKYNIPVTEDMVKQAVAQKAYSDYKNGAIDANLNEYLWKADNANKTQALAAYGSIVTKDSKLQTAMGLQSVNEAEIREYNKLTPDLATVEFFEQTYNDPDALFETEGVPPEELFRLRNGKMVSQKLFNDYVAAKDRRDLQWKALAKRRDKIWKIQDDVGDIDANIKLLEKDYNTWTSSWTTLGLTFADIGVGIGYLGMKASKYIPIGNPASVMMYAGEGLQMFTGEENEFTKFWDEWDEAFASEYDDYSYWKEGVKAQYGREVQFHADGFGRGGAFQPGNFGRFVAQEVAKQIPIITTLALTGGTAGTVLIGAYSAGQHWADADRKEYLTGIKESEWKQGAMALGYGAAEAIFERLTTVPILNRGAKLIQGLGEKSYLTYRNAMKQYFKENALHLASAPVLEASAEFGTQITQNWIDGRPIMENVDHAAFVGGMFGHAMSVTPFMAGAVARQFTDYNSFQEYQFKEREINSLEQALNQQIKKGKISEKAANTQRGVIEQLREDQKAFLEKQFGAVRNTMDDGAFDAFQYSVRKQSEISESANEELAKPAPNQKMLELYKLQFDMYQNNKDVYRNNKEFSNQFSLLQNTDPNRYERIREEARQELQNKFGGEVRPEQVNTLSQQIFKREEINADFARKKDTKKKKYLKFDTNGEAMTYVDDVIETSKGIIQNDNNLTDVEKNNRLEQLEKDKQSILDALGEGRLSGWNMMFDKNGMLTTDGDAVVRNEILGFVENAVANNETQIFTHEEGHAVFGELLGYDERAFDPIAEDVKTYLKKYNPDVYEAIITRRGSNLASDEWVMNFLEYVGNNRIDLNNVPGKLTSSAFGFNLNKIFGSNNQQEVDFKGANGTIEYLYNLGKAISEGRVTRGMIAEGRKSAVIKDARKKFQDSKRKYKKAQKEFVESDKFKKIIQDVSGFKFSDTKVNNEAAEVLNQIKEVVAKEGARSPKLAPLQEKFRKLKEKSSVVEKVPVWEGAKRDSDGNWIETDAARKERVNLIERSFRGRLNTFRGGLPMAEILNAYEGKIEGLFKKGGYYATDSYQGYSMKEALEDFTMRVNDELMKSIKAFDPKINDDFDAYIMSPSILPNKVKLANKKFAAENKNKGFNVGLEAASRETTKQETTLREFESTLREVFGVEKGSPFYGAAMTAVQEVMAEGMPKFEYTQRKRKGKGETVTLSQVRAIMKTNPTGQTKLQAERDLAGILKKVKSELQAKYQKALDKNVKQEFLKAKIYDTFLKKNKKELLDRLPIEDLVALERLSDNKILTKVVKKNLNPTEVKQYEGSGNLTTATTTQGPTLYSRLNPTEKQFVDFFNVRGRKDALAKILSAELGLDATMQNLTSEKVVDEIAKGNPQILEQLGEQALKDFALAIGRGTSFKFSLAETVGMEGQLAEDYKALQPTLIDQIIDMEVSDPMSVKLAVDVVYSAKKFAPHRTQIKKVFEKLLKPYRKAIAQEGKTEFNLQEYITSVESAIDAENSISKMWGQKPMAEALRDPDDIANFKKFDNRLAQQRLLDLAGKDKDGKQNPVTEQIKIEQAIQDLRWQYGRQKGTKPGTAKARGMVYANPAQLFEEFFLPNYGFKSVKLEGSGAKRTASFEIASTGKFTKPVPFQASPKQEVTEGMVPGGTMSQTEIDFREEIAEQAFNYVVNSYKAAKTLLDNGGGTKLDMAMLMNMYGQFMQGPIRAAAPFRYRALDAPTTELRDKDGNKNFEYEHGIPAKIFNLLVADAIFFNNKEIDLQKLKDSYAVGAIPIDMNDNFSAFFADRMQFGYEVGDIAPMRWYNMFTRGRAAYAVEDVRTGDRFGEREAKLWKEQQKANAANKFSLSNNVVDMSNLNMDEVLDYAQKVDQALKNARNPNAPVKKIRVFDFDDTLATSENVVFYTMPDGKKGQLNAEEFAKKGLELAEQGAVMDFTDFNTVRDGGTGPLADLARTIIEKRGSEDVFVLTARAPQAQQAIYDFLQGVGINIPLDNITGLGNSTGAAKAEWIVGKAAEGYNDFYFADDAIQNVQSVKAALSQIDVKSKVQQAKFKFSENVDEDFNKIIESSLGIEWYKEFSTAKGQVMGEGKGKRMIHPYSAEDFEGLLYPLLGKGKVGEANYQWFKDHLIDPYNRGVRDMNTSRINLMDDFKALKNTLTGVPKTMKNINETGFSNENSMRVYIWSQLGYDVPGLSKTDLKEINNLVENSEELTAFANQVLNISKGDYVKPGEGWLAGTITTDFMDVLKDVKRKEFLSEFIENSDIIFSEKNMAKLEAALGPKYVEAVKNILARMKSGSNRLQSQNRIADGILDYLNNAQGVVLFLNMRSALLQGISSANFINWSNNNIYKAGKAFANQPQYWSDFMRLMNSDYLIDRRNGLKMNINENEIANLAKTSKNKAKAVISYIIEKGYIPTKFMDSFAIASGGATYFRNRTNDLIENEGLTKEQAEAQAYEEFVALAEKSQQSSDPSKISQQQASDLGRIFLNWANTQMQYLRIQKKATQDIINRRGSDLDNASKIIYYGVIQNLWFQAAHAAVFALAFGDVDDEEFKENKIVNTANGMTDNILRGLGISGQVVSVLKNTAFDIYERSGRSRPEYIDAAWELIRLSPVISSKVSRVKQALWNFDSKKRRQEMIDKGFSIDNPAYMATAKIISAVTNVPVDRLLLKMENVMDATAAETETWMRIALLLGWPKWQLEPKMKKKKDKSTWGMPTKKEIEQNTNWGKSKGYESKEKNTWGQPVNTK